MTTLVIVITEIEIIPVVFFGSLSPKNSADKLSMEEFSKISVIIEDKAAREKERNLRILENEAFERAKLLNGEDAKVEYFRRVLEGKKRHRVLLYIDLENAEREYPLQKNETQFSRNFLDSINNIVDHYMRGTNPRLSVDASVVEEIQGLKVSND